ncbi:MerR family transcriptional regulator [Proteiniclasticum sp.]|uniref:MerR family transcriptional regulator n=1 Tax=Proteiniclasticum sp. TaxID=2053595 RepID=UPI00289D9607|nr:MerR family transcriptional regulator [Proteiniclasticum sp.]
MKISEVELWTGMDRTNIRYYEKEGLISPIRGDNGYRDFSDEDVERLLRIRLLRSLHVPVEKIRTLFEGRDSLDRILEEQLTILEEQNEEVNYAKELCSKMLKENSSLLNLDVRKYLNQLEHKSKELNTNYFSVKRDRLPQVYRPLRRAIARLIDIQIYSVILDSILIMGFQAVTSRFNFLQNFAVSLLVVLMMILIEPFFLSRFAVTPGKAIFGMRITSTDGEHLSYRDAMRRTFEVVRYGLGFQIPLYNYYRLYVSYKALNEEETLPWDYDIAYTMKRETIYRRALFIVFEAAVITAAVFLVQVEKLPPNRGALTIAEFVENYDHYKDIMDIDEDYELNRYGEWISTRDEKDVVLELSYYEKPAFRFNLKDQIIKSVSFEVNADGKKMPLSSNRLEIMLTTLALAGAQKEVSLFDDVLDEMISDFYLHNWNFSSFSNSLYGVDYEAEVDYTGYEEMSGVLIPLDEAVKHRYSLSFSADVD